MFESCLEYRTNLIVLHICIGGEIKHLVVLKKDYNISSQGIARWLLTVQARFKNIFFKS